MVCTSILDGKPSSSRGHLWNFFSVNQALLELHFAKARDPRKGSQTMQIEDSKGTALSTIPRPSECSAVHREHLAPNSSKRPACIDWGLKLIPAMI